MYRCSAPVRARGLLGVTAVLLSTSKTTSPQNVNMYDSKSYSRGRANTRVVVKEKPPVKSLFQRLYDYMKPATTQGEDELDTLQILKFLGYLAMPVVVLIVWKRWMVKLPDQWEQQLAGLQIRETKEGKEYEAAHKSYFNVIDDLEARRLKAIERHELQHMKGPG